jgi:hypothetical protein
VMLKGYVLRIKLSNLLSFRIWRIK